MRASLGGGGLLIRNFEVTPARKLHHLISRAANTYRLTIVAWA
jgi:hypothetical protein